MDSDYGVPRELSEVQKKRALYQPELPPCLQVRTSPLLLRSVRAPLPASGFRSAVSRVKRRQIPHCPPAGSVCSVGADFHGSPFTYS